jgi:hypothetical protein
MPIFLIIQPQRSCRATMWQAQPQNHLPRRAVERIATMKKMNPAFTWPFSRVYIDSDGSTGERVVPVTTQWSR